jgi:hypothetical protein
MALQIEEVLSLWREAERVLEELPADAPERTVMSAEVASLKQTYRRLTEENDVSAHALVVTRESIADARAALAAAKARLNGQ